MESGQMLLHYRLVEKLGEGGMGVVWKAVDTTLDRNVAIKVLPEELAEDPDRLARFEREAKVLAALSHPGVASIYSLHECSATGSGPSKGSAVRFLAMELVEGETLTRRIPQEGLPLKGLLAIAIPLADAVASAHDKGVTHRDLKPDNVMVTPSGRVKVLDFGLARLIPEPEPGGGRGTQLATQTMTGKGQILGTVSYMSPEQAESRTPDARSDVFSMGILLYELATGRRPFQGQSPISTLSAILRTTPRPLHEVRSSLPSALDAIVSRCLEKDPSRRYVDAGEVRDALRELRHDVEAGTAKTTQSSGVRSIRVVVGSLVVVALAAVAIWTVPRLRGPARLASPAAESTAPPSIAVMGFENPSAA